MENLGNAAEAAVKRWGKLEKYACLLFLIVIAGMLIRNIGFSEEIDQQSKAAVLLENGETLTCDVQVRGEMTQYPLKKDKAALVEQLSIWCGDRLVVEFQNISGALAFSASYRYTGILNREEGWLLAELDGKIVGHCLLSHFPLSKTKGGKYANTEDIVMLAPVSVHADYFHKHIGITMLTLGIQKAREAGFKGITVEGNFRFYNRLGFKTSSEYNIYPTSGYPMTDPRCMMCQETYAGSLNGIQGYIVYDMYYNA